VQEQKSTIRISDVTSEAGPGVVLASYELERINMQVKSQLAALTPNPIVAAGDPSGADALKMKLVFTRYDRGNAFARAMLAGLGQIKIDADAFLIDRTGATVAKYKISKVFAFGGLYGASTRAEDVEEGFAKSVAEIFKNKTSKPVS
jgi:hypothetical protein